ncbi:MAG TPA: hypothetical protein VJ752_09375 [Burkholderiaceae bacterium]|nr:hypothetical protein [Burkholderiaceae bacterium]
MNGVLVDTSVWVDHFRHHDAALAILLDRNMALTHRIIIGEIACGTHFGVAYNAAPGT